jgi:hypothetical protein
MLLNRLMIVLFVGASLTFLGGCGGQPQVADAPEEPVEELTPEEEAGEREYTGSQDYRN